MLRLAAAAILLAGCRVSLSNENSPVGSTDTDGGSPGDLRGCAISTVPQCVDAVSHSDLSWIEANVFVPSCDFSGCHNGAAGNASIVDLRTGKSAAHLVNFTSHLDSARKLVVPNDLPSSYLLMMLGDIAPADAKPPASALPSVGQMPQGLPQLCCQKLDAIERWITAGAPTD
jgi:hypothetical protein